MTMLDNPRLALCYNLIKEYYGDRAAKRSKVPYINHIDEGLVVLQEIKASIAAMCAYCIHPILQEDASLEENFSLVEEVPYDILILTMEYRNVANRGLCCYQVDNPEHIYLGPLKEVHDMLIADKVQYRKDFLIYHAETHASSKELDRYFRNWLRALGVLEAQYDELVKAIHKARHFHE